MKPITHNLDALVRQRLGELPPAPPDAAGWERLSSALAADADQHLRATLTGLAATAAPTGWEELERKLDPQAAADAQMTTALNGLQPATATGWETLATRLDEDNDAAVDAVVVGRLAETSAGVTSGWAALAARLELIGHRRGMIAAWKITEMSLLLSAVLLFLRFGPVAERPAPAIVGTFPAEMEMPVAPARAELELLAAEAPVVSIVTEVSVPVKQSRRAEKLPVPPRVLPTETASTPPLTEVPKTRTVPAASEQISTLEYGVKRAVHLPSPALQLPVFSKAVPVRYYAHAFVSPFDANQVVTPSTQIRDFDISGDDRITQGYSAGLLIDIMQGKNGLQIGAVYARRSYIPTALKWYLQEEYPIIEPLKGYSRFVHHTISFPLSYQRVIRTTDNWRFSARVGMSMSVIAKSDFLIPEGDQEDLVDAFNGRLDRYNQPATGFNPGSGGRSNTYRSPRKLTNPEPGWLEGGSLLQNASFYLGGGIMVERLLTPRWSVYASPSFGRVIYFDPETGIGPYNDRIHVGNLRLGARYLMSNK